MRKQILSSPSENYHVIRETENQVDFFYFGLNTYDLAIYLSHKNIYQMLFKKPQKTKIKPSFILGKIVNLES